MSSATPVPVELLQAMVAVACMIGTRLVRGGSHPDFFVVSYFGPTRCFNLLVGSKRHKGPIFQLDANRWNLELNKLA